MLAGDPGAAPVLGNPRQGGWLPLAELTRPSRDAAPAAGARSRSRRGSRTLGGQEGAVLGALPQPHPCCVFGTEWENTKL